MFVTADGGLTGAGYGLFIILAVIALVAAAAVFKGNGKRWSAKQLAFCGIAIALAFATSYVHLFKLPFGGSVTLFSMLFIVLTGYWFGPVAGLLAGFSYGVLQFLQDPYFLSVVQVCFDYLFAFAALGLSGLFKNKKNGLLKGYLLGIFGRGVFASLAGYLFWMEYMPENFPASLAAIYPIVYNYSYILAEGIITVIILQIPAVKKALARVGAMAE